MAGLIPQSFIDDLLGRSDILDVVGARVQLKKTGKNYSACCPFHNEKTPSFTVSPDKQFYYCFGCGAGGNALGFVMDFDRVDFPQAVEELAKRAGLEVPREDAREGPSRRPADSPLYALLQAAADYYRQALKSHPQRRAAVDYLKGRGLSGTIARDFAIGFAPPGWDSLLKHLGGDPLSQKHLIDAGLLVENEGTGKRYDRFRDRVIFPIRDRRGRVIAFGGRVLGDDKPKYLNSPETSVFHKGQELYGLFEARQYNRDLSEILVVEGYMDVIALAQHGIRNAVATLGTATSEEHLRRIFRLTPNVLFCFDGDQAGRHAAWRALQATLPNLKDGCRARFLFLPDGEDPDSLVRDEGKDSFLARIAQQAQPLTDYLFEQLTEEAPPTSLEGRAHLATLAMPLIERIPGANLQRLMLQRLSEITGLPSLSPAPSSAFEQSNGERLPERQGGTAFEQPAPLARSAVAESGQGLATSLRPGMATTGPAMARPGTVGKVNNVEPPKLVALRTLLHRPELAGSVDDAMLLAGEKDTYGQLLAALLEALQKRPQLSAVQLLARWHGTEQGRLLRALADKEWLIQPDNLEQQFFDTINRLKAGQRERRLEHLLSRARSGQLDNQEKDQLKALLQRGQPGAPG